MMIAIPCLLLVLSYACTVHSAVTEDPGPCGCCDKNQLFVDLRNGRVIGGSDSLEQFGAEEVYNEIVGDSEANLCDDQIVLKVTFGAPENPDVKCSATCGRRMLRVDMVYDLAQLSGYSFNIGNSISNDGHKGDNGDNSYDSEVHSVNSNIQAMSNDNCTTSYSYPNAVNETVSVRIGSGFYEISNSVPWTAYRCDDECFFELSDKYDSEKGAINDREVYTSFNRVIKTSSPRTGSGVCWAVLSWDCCDEVAHSPAEPGKS